MRNPLEKIEQRQSHTSIFCLYISQATSYRSFLLFAAWDLIFQDCLSRNVLLGVYDTLFPSGMSHTVRYYEIYLQRRYVYLSICVISCSALIYFGDVKGRGEERYLAT